MNPMDDHFPPGAAEPMDDRDTSILEGIRELCTVLDPVPADLVKRVQFAIALQDLDVEVSRLLEETEFAEVAVRGEEQSRLVTFDSDELTVMVNISPNEDRTIRLDGWLMPPACHPLELRTESTSLAATADDQGRFSFEGVPRGLAQMVVRPIAGNSAAHRRSVVTPAIVL